jgi:hypothetical protein
MLRTTVSRPVSLGVDPHLSSKKNFCYCQTFAGLLMWGALSEERTGLSVYNCCWPLPAQSFSRPSPSGLSQIRRVLQSGGPGQHIYISEEQGDPVIPTGTGFPFHRLLRLAGLRWNYSNPPQGGDNGYSKSESRVTLRLTIYRKSVRLGDEPLETHYQYFYFPTEHWRL